MTTHFTDLAARAAEDGTVTQEEILALRREGWGDGIMSKPEAEALFTLNRALDTRSDAWCDFFVEAIGEFVLNGTPPRAQCSTEEADWLIAQIDHDGSVESRVELETLVRIIERAENVPAALKDYVLVQIEREVMTGIGPTRDGGALCDTRITASEARILRRVIFGSGGDGPASASRREAAMLFRLKDATLGADNAPEWDEIFLDGVLKYLRGFTLDSAQLSHERKRELQAFIADNSANVGRFFGRMAKAAPAVHNHLGKVFGQRESGVDYNEKAKAGEVVTGDERAWLDTMIEADGEVDALERRLLERLLSND
ncbi:MAG: hypothetical protein V2J51_02015 [Erythrobacter sp.]|jgi:hypothetical protein|nr:hypothetical protein [Erythrobacter sp.]